MEIGGSTLLVHFQKNGYDVYRLKPYEYFLLECKQKDINAYAKHKHHILPVFMGGGNEHDNFIELTPEDHFNAHLVLAECFDKGMPEHHFNISSANLVMRHAKRALRKVFGDKLPDNISEFWKQANIYMKDAMKGENSYMFGKTHPETWRSAHSKKMMGVGNPMYGNKNPHSNETKQKLSNVGKELAKERFPMPEGVFGGKSVDGKCFWRFCPTCNSEIRHTRRDAAGRGHRDRLECKSCSIKTGSSKTKGRKLIDTSHLKGLKKDYTNVGKYNKHGHNNPNAKKIIDPKTGKVYGTMKELCLELQITIDMLRPRIKKGDFIYGNA